MKKRYKRKANSIARGIEPKKVLSNNNECFKCDWREVKDEDKAFHDTVMICDKCGLESPF